MKRVKNSWLVYGTILSIFVLAAVACALNASLVGSHGSNGPVSVVQSPWPWPDDDGNVAIAQSPWPWPDDDGNVAIAQSPWPWPDDDGDLA